MSNPSSPEAPRASDSHRRVMLWSAPRSVSTAFEHSVCALPGIKGFHEPYSTAYYLGEERISPRYRAITPVEGYRFDDVKALLESDQPDATAVFAKDMAYAIDGDLARLPQDFTHSFLIRDPRRSVKSILAIIDSGRVPEWSTFIAREVGYADLIALYEHAASRQNRVAVVDADDLLLHPRQTMRAYCNAVGLDFDPCMLSWDANDTASRWELWGVEWYESLMSSTRFEARRSIGEPPDLQTFPDEVREALEQALPLYRRLHAARIDVSERDAS